MINAMKCAFGLHDHSFPIRSEVGKRYKTYCRVCRKHFEDVLKKED